VFRAAFQFTIAVSSRCAVMNWSARGFPLLVDGGYLLGFGSSIVDTYVRMRRFVSSEGGVAEVTG